MASTSTQRQRVPSTMNFGKYDVFLSFKGEDTRMNFTDHLYANLVAYKIHTFRDNEELEKGGDIASDISRAIEESRVFIIVFSKNYAHSSWCLNELVKIFECMTRKKSVVVPVFYHVDPSDVRNQVGSYGDAFTKHERDANKEKRQMIRKWRISLREVANISGYHVDNTYETKVVKEITSGIVKRLNLETLSVSTHIVGMEFHLEKLKSLMNTYLNKVCIVGFYGIGGIGKTTIAKAVYNAISNQFDGSSFLENVRERFEDNTLQLQQELLHGILKGKGQKVSNIDEGIKMIKRSLSSKRVLIVFDDVDDLNNLEHLAEEHGWFSRKSTIIITTRNKQLLTQYGANVAYEVPKLNNKEAIELFSLWAFRQNLPEEPYKNLSYDIVGYAKGLPLALKVLGCFLSEKEVIEWESALRKFKTIPHMKIHNVLKISYDKLDDIDKGIFLDIACFWKGEERDFVSRILGSHAENGIRVLHDQCLITISENKLEMHDLIQQMAGEIIRREKPKNPGKRSRLWQPNDVYNVLTRNTGTSTVEGIFLDVSILKKQILFTSEAFKMMNRLRLLKIHQDTKYNSLVELEMVEDPLEVHLSEVELHAGFEFPSRELTYLHWDGYSLESLPSDFEGDDLVELSLRCSKIKQLWKGSDKPFENLKVINLSYSLHLIKIPSFSTMPNLEIVILEGCVKLESLPSDICDLKHLQTLCCRHCSKLKSFPEIKGTMKNLRELYLSYTAIKGLPSSIKHLKGLEHLDLESCKNLVHVPKSICKLESLKTLDFGGCSELKNLPGNLKTMQCLEELYFSGISCQLPSLSGLYSLKVLIMPNCNPTGGIFHNIFHLLSLEKLDLSNCNIMEEGIAKDIFHLSLLQALDLSGTDICFLPAGISQLSKLKFLGLSHCKKLQEIPELPSSLQVLDAHDCACLQGSFLIPSLPWQRSLWGSLFNSFKSEIQDLERRCSHHDILFGQSGYVGKGISVVIPRKPGIPDQNLGNRATIVLPTNWYEDNNFLGFGLWAVYVPLSHDEFKDEYDDRLGDAPAIFSGLGCSLSIHGDDQFKYEDYLYFYSGCKCFHGGVSSQTWIMYYPHHTAIKEKYSSSQRWKFQALFVGNYGYGTRHFVVEKCGVQLLYAQDHQQTTF